MLGKWLDKILYFQVNYKSESLKVTENYIVAMNIFM